MDTTRIPDKLNFRIGEVCDIVGVKPHVLRYWETEFSRIRPAKTAGGLRRYSRRDVETILKIKYLLYEKGYTIAGAKKALPNHMKKGDNEFDIGPKVLEELKAIRNILSEKKEQN